MTRHKRRTQAEHKAIARSRYGSNYSFICYVAHSLVDNICCNCVSAPSEEVHHAMYRDKYGRIKSREIPGIHVFPLCKKCHDSVAHSKFNWYIDDDESYNQNNLEYYKLLKKNFQLLNNSRKRA